MAKDVWEKRQTYAGERKCEMMAMIQSANLLSMGILEHGVCNDTLKLIISQKETRGR